MSICFGCNQSSKKLLRTFVYRKHESLIFLLGMIFCCFTGVMSPLCFINNNKQQRPCLLLSSLVDAPKQTQTSSTNSKTTTTHCKHFANTFTFIFFVHRRKERLHMHTHTHIAVDMLQLFFSIVITLLANCVVRLFDMMERHTHRKCMKR